MIIYCLRAITLGGVVPQLVRQPLHKHLNEREAVDRYAKVAAVHPLQDGVAELVQIVAPHVRMLVAEVVLEACVHVQPHVRVLGAHMLGKVVQRAVVDVGVHTAAATIVLLALHVTQAFIHCSGKTVHFFIIEFVVLLYLSNYLNLKIKVVQESSLISFIV